MLLRATFYIYVVWNEEFGSDIVSEYFYHNNRDKKGLLLATKLVYQKSLFPLYVILFTNTAALDWKTFKNHLFF